MAKKRPSRIESSFSLPSLLQVPNWSESSSTYLPIGSYHVGALLLLLEEPTWEDSRVVILASVRSTFIHSLTYPSLCQVHEGT